MDNNTLATFLPDHYYHIYNRTNNKEDLFLSDDNRIFFLDLVRGKLSGFANILGFSLMENHFHLCIITNSHLKTVNYIKSLPPSKKSLRMKQFIENQEDADLFNDVFSYLFSGIFNSYSQSFNRKNSRKGNLFYSSFKRSLLETQTKIQFIIYYIHHNARKHGVVIDFKKHEWNSYHLISINDDSIIDIKSTLKVFGNYKQFLSYHEEFLLPNDQLL
jgi:REP element-mobilizing transposase RayT